MTDETTRPSNFPWAVAVYLSAVVASIFGGLFYPLPWFTAPLSDMLFAIGLLIVIGAVLIVVSAIRAMVRAKTTVLPNKGASHLVTNGPFAFSRHPIYLANTMAMFGLGLIGESAWFFIFALVAAFVTRKLAIEPEERHLTAKFGKKYRDYSRRVRRWI